MVKQIQTKRIPGTTNSINMQDIPLEKVRVGDINIAYKVFGKTSVRRGQRIISIISCSIITTNKLEGSN